jgi:hypothetical protein
MLGKIMRFWMQQAESVWSVGVTIFWFVPILR